VQLRRLVMISQRLRPFAGMWNERAIGWQWEVNLIGSPQINAFCMPGGKIAFYWGILTKLQLSDDEVAMVMGHEMTHALREHGARADRQAGGHARHDRAAGAACSAGATPAARWPARGPAAVAEVQPRRRDRGRPDRPGARGARRLQPQAALSLWRRWRRPAAARRRRSCRTIRPTRTACAVIAANIPRVQGLYNRAPKPDRALRPPLAG
jgi:hypothetical protein